MRVQFGHSYAEIISVENLLEAWKEFKRGKTKKEGVQQFQLRLMEHILTLHMDLRNRTYRHGQYKHFRISDPKPRDIHKASVRDRLLHHALYRKLYPFFDRTFIADSFSCRLGKGTHAAMDRFRAFAYKVSRNHTRTCFVLKCDIRKFFANIDHDILFSVLARYISDADISNLLKNIVGSFSTSPLNLLLTEAVHLSHPKTDAQGLAKLQVFASHLKEGERKKGLPLGNLTSQLLVNIYMNEFDQFVKHTLKVKRYIRYADDFVLLSPNKTELEHLLPPIRDFLHKWLKLSLHPDKVCIKTLASGVDFLGWVHFPDHRVLRTATRRRIFRRISEYNFGSYLGLCKQGNTFGVQQALDSFVSS